jgi:anthranilate synthase/aminodeoxychorismate synthase-like glutamine amidotransferase
MPMIREFSGKLPVLGVCLGHQALIEAFGGRIVRAPRLMHGKTSPVRHDGRGLFAGLPNPFEAGRYHSLIVERDTIPAGFEASAWTEEGEVMGVRHRTLAVEGVQFHPESILTPEGPRLLAAFLRL